MERGDSRLKSGPKPPLPRKRKKKKRLKRRESFSLPRVTARVFHITNLAITYYFFFLDSPYPEVTLNPI